MSDLGHTPEVKLTRNHEFWTEEDMVAVARAKSFRELSDVAMKVLKRMPQPVGQVCGPISTGGAGSLEANLKVFDETIQKLIDEGKVIFDQMPFEDHFYRLMEGGWSEQHQNKLLADFYQPLFESRLIGVFYFISGWESSRGATWEREMAEKLGIEIVDLEN